MAPQDDGSSATQCSCGAKLSPDSKFCSTCGKKSGGGGSGAVASNPTCSGCGEEIENQITHFWEKCHVYMHFQSRICGDGSILDRKSRQKVDQHIRDSISSTPGLLNRRSLFLSCT